MRVATATYVCLTVLLVLVLWAALVPRPSVTPIQEQINQLRERIDTLEADHADDVYYLQGMRVYDPLAEYAHD